jgi:exodeoxyribonuclease VII large subunit
MPGEPPGKRVFSVGELTRRLKGVVETTFPRIRVEGELSNFKVYASGHAYFTLKDNEAQIKGVIWRTALGRVRFEPKDGDQVVVTGKISVYEPRGEYQIVVDAMEPKGLGALQAAFEALKKKLIAEGLFADARKRPLPRIAWNVGIVTSPSGAVIRDMIRTLNRRFPGLRVVLAPVAVQGEEAAPQIAQALADLNRLGGLDVIIVGRGGGSLEDLWAFNEEIVARAIAASAVPVVSAVGHETDFTIADFVADRRASTPTAAAEMVAPERDAVEDFVDQAVRRMTAELTDLVEGYAQRTDEFGERLAWGIRRTAQSFRRRIEAAARHLAALSPAQRLKHDRQRLTVAETKLTHALTRLAEKRRAGFEAAAGRIEVLRPIRWVERADERTARLEQRLAVAMTRGIDARSALFRSTVGKLDAYSPLAVLSRGYAIVTDEKGAVVKSAGAVKDGDSIALRLADGSVEATVGRTKTGRQERLF